jgi:predicted metal-dependent HD superfamily phosphohydrolase
MATRHEAVPQTRDEKVLVDVDLWILGAPPERFDEYEKQVREEYGWVPGLIYRRKRRAILESFVARQTIYSTERFIQRYEVQARANLARSLARR